MGFKRGLSKHFVDLLNEAGSWWKSILSDPKLFVGIREEYLNIYYRGNSILLLEPDGDDLIKGQTHYKYLLNQNSQKQIAMDSDGKYRIEPAKYGDSFMTKCFSKDDLKKSSKYYAGIEKTGVHNIIIQNYNVIDVEIAFNEDKKEKRVTTEEEIITENGEVAPPNMKDGRERSRIDFSAITKVKENYEIWFYEAKHFTNKELSADGGKHVLGQLEKYSKELGKNRQNLLDSYHDVLANWVGLDGFPKQKKAFAREVLDNYSKVEINTLPFLVIFGFDEDQKKGSIWKKQLEQITSPISRDRVLLKGNTSRFTLRSAHKG